MHPADTKRALRASIQERLQHVSDKERGAESRSLCRTIAKLLPPDLQHLCAFYPLRSEADLRPLLRECLAKGIAVYLPRFDGRDMRFHRIESFESLEQGPFGIPEPKAEEPLLPDDAAVTVLVPGLCFDDAGRRLGRGNGAFDTWIAQQRAGGRKAQYWGTALECQRTHAVPVEAHDQAMDAVITARGFLKPKSAPVTTSPDIR